MPGTSARLGGGQIGHISQLVGPSSLHSTPTHPHPQEKADIKIMETKCVLMIESNNCSTKFIYHHKDFLFFRLRHAVSQIDSNLNDELFVMIWVGDDV